MFIEILQTSHLAFWRVSPKGCETRRHGSPRTCKVQRATKLSWHAMAYGSDSAPCGYRDGVLQAAAKVTAITVYY